MSSIFNSLLVPPLRIVYRPGSTDWIQYFHTIDVGAIMLIAHWLEVFLDHVVCFDENILTLYIYYICIHYRKTWIFGIKNV